MKEIKSPSRENYYNSNSIFLAGSIEMGSAENWQEKIVKELHKFSVTVYNPRRDDWDSSWVQDFHNPQFYDQVNWELDMLDKSDIIVMYLDPNTKSPISLLELGLYAGECGIGNIHNKDMIVCCPKGFWRKGNVDIVCQRYGIPCFDNIETLLVALKAKLS